VTFPFDTNPLGLLLIGVALTALGVRIASWSRPEWSRWGQLAGLVILGLFGSLVVVFALILVVPDPKI
jgi:hypothetical protein